MRSPVIAGVLVIAATGVGQSDGGGGSVLDGVEPDVVASDYTGTRHALADLIVGPAALGEYRVVTLQVDDPNGNGLIDGRWFPPRIRTGNCQVSVDAAPIPTAVAGFIPGSPADLLDADPFASMDAAMSAEHSIGIQVWLFDEASQRDEYAATMVEFYTIMPTFGCDVDSPLSDMVQGGESHLLLPRKVPHPGVAFAIDTFMTESVITQYSVGDRILVAVSVANGITNALEGGPAIDPRLANQAIDAEIARLEASTS